MANQSDVSQAHALLHGHEVHAFGDGRGYQDVEKRDEIKASPRHGRCHQARQIKAMRDGALKDLLIAFERTKAPDSGAGRTFVPQ